eukprot:jgi/Picre1/30270/NNA_005636.t1
MMIAQRLTRSVPTVSTLSLTTGSRRHAITVSAVKSDCTDVMHQGVMGRRGAVLGAGLLAAVQLMATPLPALALIPDDDDEEMVQKAKANRQKRLAGEKKAEKEFSRAEGFVDRGGLDASKTAASVKTLSLDSASQSAGETAMAELNSLVSALGSGSLDGAKKEYVDTVIALTDWTVKANISGLKGI